eukprot:Opistho-2@47097
MPAFIQLWNGRNSILEDYYRTLAEADAAREVEYKAAVVIQSAWRGYHVRRHLKFLADHATVIQRYYRGLVGRRIFTVVVLEMRRKRRMAYYHHMATLIQKTWRGFHCRKYVSNFYTRKRFLEGLVKKNEAVARELDLYEQQRREDKRRDAEEKERLATIRIASHLHHLVGTKNIPGVLANPVTMHTRTAGDVVIDEEQVKQTFSLRLAKSVGGPTISVSTASRRTLGTTASHPQYIAADGRENPLGAISATPNNMTESVDGSSVAFRGEGSTSPSILLGVHPGHQHHVHASHGHSNSRFAATNSAYTFKSEATVSLPAIRTAKVQGPFKAPEEVHKLRSLPLRPSLRVATAYESELEARNAERQQEYIARVTDRPFVVPAHGKAPAYVPSVHARTTYGAIDYGTKTFRDDRREGRAHDADFKTVVSPIPIFDDYAAKQEGY